MFPNDKNGTIIDLEFKISTFQTGELIRISYQSRHIDSQHQINYIYGPCQPCAAAAAKKSLGVNKTLLWRVFILNIKNGQKWYVKDALSSKSDIKNSFSHSMLRK